MNRTRNAQRPPQALAIAAIALAAITTLTTGTAIAAMATACGRRCAIRVRFMVRLLWGA